MCQGSKRVANLELAAAVQGIRDVIAPNLEALAGSWAELGCDG